MENNIDFTKGWERVHNPKTIRRYSAELQSRGKAASKLYRKWVEPFEFAELARFCKELSQAHIAVDEIIFDPRGYVVAPKSALH